MDNTILVRVFDADLHPTGIEYKLVDTPLKRFVPEWAHPIIVRKLPFGIDAPEADSLSIDIQVGDLTYWAGVLSDTHGKEGVLRYVEKEDAMMLMARFQGFFKYAEDTVRLGRALIPSAQNYGSFSGPVRVKVVAEGDEEHGIQIKDGTGIVSSRLISKQGRAIELGPTSNNFSIWQDLDFDEIKDDVKALGKQLRRDVRNMSLYGMFHNEQDNFGTDSELKDRFLGLCPELIRHPWFSNAIGDVAANWMSSHAFAPYLSMTCYLAIANKHWTLPKGKWLTYRHPKIAGAGLRALDIKRTHKLPEHINGGGVWTLTGFHPGGEATTMKFCGPIIDMDDWDVIVCDRNIKLGKRKAPHEETMDGCLVTLMRYARQALLGVPYDDFKPMNGDYDGDLINVVSADGIQQIFANVEKHQNDSASFKFVHSSNTPWTREAAVKVVLNAMHSSMGGATNANSWWKSMNIKERTQVLPKIWPAAIELMLKMNTDMEPKDLPEMSLEAMDHILQYHIQYHIDAIKNTNCDTYRVASAEARLTSILASATDKIPGYLTFKRAIAAGVAFKKVFPRFMDDDDPLVHSHTKVDTKAKRHFDWRIQIPNRIHGTPVQCFKINQEPLMWMFESMLERQDNLVNTRIYSKWVPLCSGSDYTHAEELVGEWRKHIIRFERMRTKGLVSMTNPDDVMMYREQWRDICAQYTSDFYGGDRMRAAIALWRVGNDTGESLVAGAVFIGFTDESEAIVKKYAGSVTANRCIVIGVKSLVPVLPAEIKGDCELITINGSVCVHLEHNLPENKERLFGKIAEVKGKEIEEGLSIPADGKYRVHMTLRPSGTAYFAVFEAI